MAMSCATGSRAGNAEASDKRFQLGVDYFSKGMVSAALEELIKAVDLDPNNADAHNLLGLVWLRKGADAEDMATRSQCLKGEELVLEKQEMDGHFKKAAERFHEAVRLRPDFSEAYNNLAVVSTHFGKYDDAVGYAEKALSNVVYREPYAARGNLGLAYLNKQEYAKAAKELRQAIFDEPRFCVGRYRLAKVYYEQKDYERAGEEIDKVMGDKACPIQEAAYLAGLVALRRGDRQRAAMSFERCIQLAPKSCLAVECGIAR